LVLTLFVFVTIRLQRSNTFDNARHAFGDIGILLEYRKVTVDGLILDHPLQRCLGADMDCLPATLQQNLGVHDLNFGYEHSVDCQVFNVIGV
jgi:hypothetical protein